VMRLNLIHDALLNGATFREDGGDDESQVVVQTMPFHPDA